MPRGHELSPRRISLDSISRGIFRLKIHRDVCFLVQNYAEEEEEEETPATSSSSTTTSTTTTTTTTTTTSTTPRPAITQNYDYRDPRAYEGGSGAQYNGYQSRSDYPPMSAHSVHKWQSLGTREGVKETRSSMQQYNKNGKSKLASIYAPYFATARQEKVEGKKPARGVKMRPGFRSRREKPCLDNRTVIEIPSCRFMQIFAGCPRNRTCLPSFSGSCIVINRY